MDHIPGRRLIAVPYRTALYWLEQRMPALHISPSACQVAGLVLSVACLYIENAWIKALSIALVLLFDWLDGVTARQQKTASRSGYIADVVVDRASEGFIFAGEVDTPIGQAFYILWLVNVALAFYSVKANKHTSLPLRFAYLFPLIWQGLAG
jgi:phosphatidylglycerophosphate synthase